MARPVDGSISSEFVGDTYDPPELERAREIGVRSVQQAVSRTVSYALSEHRRSPFGRASCGENMSVYEIVKGKIYPLVQIVTGRSNSDAMTEGYRDIYELLMSDSDHPRQQQFLMQLPAHLPEGHRQILLDGLAKEYAGVDGWMAYVARETK